MPELRIPLDPCNPGQFFACCGLLELLELYRTGTLTVFEIDARLTRRAEFVVRVDHTIPLQQLLDDLRRSTAHPLPHPEETIAPVELRHPLHALTLNWWLEDTLTSKRLIKSWGGQQTGLGILRDLLEILPAPDDPVRAFDQAVSTSTRLGVDPRSAWNALDCGYSPNEQKQDALTFPFVEVLAAIGLQGFRPGVKRDSARVLSYALWEEFLPRAAARAACAAPWEGLKSRPFDFRLLDRGQGYKVFEFGKYRRVAD